MCWKSFAILISFIVITISGNFTLADCPSADLNGDCFVDFEDFALMAAQWLTTDPCIPEGPNSLVWIDINDPGFTGYMSKYETTNAQYCQFLNDALASGDITVIDIGTIPLYVKGANGSNSGADFVDETYFWIYYSGTSPSGQSQIAYSGGTFSVRSRDGYDMSDHPVTVVSWYGAAAFCNYYGYRLPTRGEWMAVADYDGSYTYGCGTSIDHSKANYDNDNPLGLSSVPYTSPVDYYPSYGYGMNDMAGNVCEWTNPPSGSVDICGGAWDDDASKCTVSYWLGTGPQYLWNFVGFRVCR